jgi:hypothetical protein
VRSCRAGFRGGVGGKRGKSRDPPRGQHYIRLEAMPSLSDRTRPVVICSEHLVLVLYVKEQWKKIISGLYSWLRGASIEAFFCDFMRPWKVV